MHDNPQHKRAYQRAYSKAKYDDLASTPEGRELLRARARAKYQRRKETQTGQALQPQPNDVSPITVASVAG